MHGFGTRPVAEAPTGTSLCLLSPWLLVDNAAPDEWLIQQVWLSRRGADGAVRSPVDLLTSTESVSR